MATNWFVRRGDNQAGPLPLEDIKEMVLEGAVLVAVAVLVLR